MRAVRFGIGTPALAAFALGASLGATACSSETDDAHTGPPGGPVAGPADDHCGDAVQATSQAACAFAGTGGTSPSGEMGDPSSGYGATLSNAAGDDDDCKYHFAFTQTDVYRDDDVTFTVTIENKTDGSPVRGANPLIEAFLNETHPAPNSGQKAVESAAGVYEVGPVTFDASGTWTVRFHVFDDCTDLHEESPHSHVAFYLDVP